MVSGPTIYRDSALPDNTGQSSEPATSVRRGAFRSRGERVLEDCRKTILHSKARTYLIPIVLQSSAIHLLRRRLQSGCPAHQWRKSSQIKCRIPGYGYSITLLLRRTTMVAT